MRFRFEKITLILFILFDEPECSKSLNNKFITNLIIVPFLGWYDVESYQVSNRLDLKIYPQEGRNRHTNRFKQKIKAHDFTIGL